MSRKYLLLDCNYLCHRAKHSTGGLSYAGDATGVIYGFLKSLSGFQDFFGTSDFVFCWDSNTSKRKEIYPEYKAQREKKYIELYNLEMSDGTKYKYKTEEIEFDMAFRKQMKKLRTTYLPIIGFKNVFIQRGYESDDIIAAACHTISHIKAEAVIVTSDKDLYQCIRPYICCYNPQSNKILTYQGFKKLYGILPHEWAMVKGTAGCPTDNVKGVKGVGEKTALKYMTETLAESTKAYKAITSKEGFALYERNMELVRLPMKGTKNIKLMGDELSEQGWKSVCNQLGMRTIRDRLPFGKRRRK